MILLLCVKNFKLYIKNYFYIKFKIIYINNMKYSIAITGFSCWTGLGFYRGRNHYKYKND
jgi:hypothetical protein